MIAFGLRLSLAGGREALVRLLTIAGAVAIGVGLLLTTVAGVNAVNTQNARYSWLNAGFVTPPGPADATAPLLWKITSDYHAGDTVGRVDVAVTGADAPVPPGLPRLPGPGEFYASPALAHLLDTLPADQLADRYPGHEVGIIGDAALPSPDTLLIVVGRVPAELSAEADVRGISTFPTTSPSDCGQCAVGIRALGLDLILSVVAIALLFPVLMFIGTATRLAATRREQRFAAMRLVGATPRQISVISAVESTASALAGTAVGFGVFLLLRSALATVPLTGARFFTGDLSLHWIDAVAVAVGVPVAAAVAARLALRRVHISPLGVTRRVTPTPPRAYRLIPMLAGLAELAYFINRPRPRTGVGQVEVFLPGFLVVMAGLVIAGPWLTMVAARLLARRTSRLSTLIATRRMADNPKTAFRSVSGLVLALFVASAAVGIMGTILVNRSTEAGPAQATNLIEVIDRDRPLAALPSGLTSVPGVTGVAATRDVPREMEPTEVRFSPGDPPPVFYGSFARCADLAASADFGRCAPGADIVWVDSHLATRVGASTVWPAAPVGAAEFDALPITTVVVATDGTAAALERARTALMAAIPDHVTIGTEAEWNADQYRTMNGWQRLADVAVIASLAIAGCSLAVSVAGGLTDRKRPFSMLRLTGVPLATLRKVVTLESAAPLLIAAVVAVGTGFLAAQLFLTAQMHYSLAPPGLAFYAIVVAGLAASLGIIASTLPLLRRITGPETARNE